MLEFTEDELDFIIEELICRYYPNNLHILILKEEEYEILETIRDKAYKVKWQKQQQEDQLNVKINS